MNGACRCPVRVRLCARACPRVPRGSPAGPALPAAQRPRAPLPWASCDRLFVCEPWWRWRQRQRRQEKEGNRINNVLVPAGNGRQTRSPPPSLSQEAGNAGTDAKTRRRPRPGGGGHKEARWAWGWGLSPDVRVVPHQHPHLHLDAGRIFQLQNFSQMGHHGVQPGGLGLLREKTGLTLAPVPPPPTHTLPRPGPAAFSAVKLGRGQTLVRGYLEPLEILRKIHNMIYSQFLQIIWGLDTPLKT